MPEIQHFQHNVTVGYIRVVVDANLQVPAYWGHPQVGGPFPGVILLHDDWGLTDHMRALVRRFAEVGYYVMAPDLFESNRATNQQEADALEVHYKEFAPPKVAAALRALETHHKCNAKMAVIGWDLGADLTFKLALEQRDIMAAIAFYGDASEYLGQFEHLVCPLLAIMGANDEITARTADALRDDLENTQKVHDLIIYPDAPHGFYNDMSPAYHQESAEDALQKVLHFLKTHQGEPPPPDQASPGFFKPGRVY